jgi:hypothetical protein
VLRGKNCNTFLTIYWPFIWIWTNFYTVGSNTVVVAAHHSSEMLTTGHYSSSFFPYSLFRYFNAAISYRYSATFLNFAIPY